MADRLSKEQRSRLMARIKSKDTLIERIMAKEMLDAGLVFESYCRDLPGTPDFAFRRQKVAVFCDSEFWHGYRRGPKRLSRYPSFWQEKIAANKRRDSSVNGKLARRGWTVVRLWGRHIQRDPKECLELVAEAIRKPESGARS
jgi:DNA mismatch endonuclease, patch repair protein